MVCVVTQFSVNDIVTYVMAYIPYLSSTDGFWISLQLIVPIWFSSKSSGDLASVTHEANTSHRATQVSLFSPSRPPAAQGKAPLGLPQNHINSPTLDGFFL